MSNKKLSIWTADSNWQPSTLREIMTPAYSDDGDSLGSEFTNAFSLGFIDDDLVEADSIEPTNYLEKAIEDFSYDFDISSDIKRKNTPPLSEKINTVIVVYDFAYGGTTTASIVRGVEVTYRGQFEYQDQKTFTTGIMQENRVPMKK
ncbi:immunity 22 family protein [Pseudomonas koreensis]|uniref:Immunity 22 family protein n=1 Tax=Pseudomonas koreensis TaxID=198620 RepID=A0A9X3BFU9_9PSED|nr:immunity 22 family protein [Pseudomonas koreensis]MCU7251613.1 immunity 22 family protein [Pseudomonas koreensis]